MPLSVLILAAGKGTRMNSNYPKVLHNVGNIPMIYYSIDLAQKLNATNIGVVISENAVEIRNFIKRFSKKIEAARHQPHVSKKLKRRILDLKPYPLSQNV